MLVVKTKLKVKSLAVLRLLDTNRQIDKQRINRYSEHIKIYFP